ncbi:MAG: FAD-dependent oxidoreductase [Oscillospiraceae bacterium]|jgi:thioredoxin reductase (NADPH)|nr:FAD-dependent oxidoreductase [Oscillospiraceae bacterium]
MRDIIIIGGGPAGVSAALTARNRGKRVTIISNGAEQSNLWKAALIENYPGLPNISGEALLRALRGQLAAAGIETVTGRALNALDMRGSFSVSVGPDYYDARALILAVGITQQSGYPGEQEFLGRGVSYCATCDGMLFRGKKVAVVGLNAEAAAEAAFLRSIGCEVTFFDRQRAKAYEIKGADTVTELLADGVPYPVSGVFILRSTIAPGSFLQGLALENGHLVTDAVMKTALDGVYAAGDCTGKPYQIAKAVGQGNTAALAACEYLDKV